MTASTAPRPYTLDAVTFEVLKNALGTIVDEMGEQILRTCHSFVIYNRDFSSALCDPEGNTIAQGSQDLASHVGTLHLTARAVIEAFGDDVHEGDVFMINDPYAGGTHFSDVRLLRPIFADGQLIAYAQSAGHWADIGGAVPGSFDASAREHFGEGVRIPPVRVIDRGVVRDDVVRLISSNTRVPDDVEGDMRAQIAATAVAEREIHRLCAKYGRDTVVTAFSEVQDYVERMARRRIADLPDGTWEAVDHIDLDPDVGEGLIPIRVKLTIDGDGIRYDLSGSHGVIGSILNAGYGGSFSAVVAGTKTFFPEVPLNSGFYRAVTVELGERSSAVNAQWPASVTGFCAGVYEKVMNATFLLWSRLMPERAMACSFNLEYLLVGGHDARSEDRPLFMWYDWMAGGWGGRNGKDGHTATAPVFGVGLAVQPVEGQERLTPVVTTGHSIIADSGGPGRWRGGCGVEKGGSLSQVDGAVMSYCCDRARSIPWGIEGGLPSMPHGLWLTREGESATFLGAQFSNVRVGDGDHFTRPSAGGGGFGDPLDRDVAAVVEDVVDGYVTLERARRDYGVVVQEVDRDLALYEVDHEATEAERAAIAGARRGWLREDAEHVAERYRAGALSVLDVVRRYAVVLDWGTGELFPNSTRTFRALVEERAAAAWKDRG
jgi:N-methylhydantoinase B